MELPTRPAHGGAEVSLAHPHWALEVCGAGLSHGALERFLQMKGRLAPHERSFILADGPIPSRYTSVHPCVGVGVCLRVRDAHPPPLAARHFCV